MPHTTKTKEAAEAKAIALLTKHSKPLSHHETEILQDSLNTLGLSAGKVDGDFGPITGGAIHRLMKNHPEIELKQLPPNAAQSVRLHKALAQADTTLNHAPKKQDAPKAEHADGAHHGQKRIVIDIGHGSPNQSHHIDSGAVVEHKGKTVLEKDINEQVATKLRAILEARGYEVSFSDRDKAGNLRDQHAFKQRTHSDPGAAFISLHSDMRFGAKSEGMKVILHENEHKDGKTSLSEKFGTHLLRTTKSDYDNLDYMRLFVLSPRMHSHKGEVVERPLKAMVELGAIDNPDEFKQLTSFAGQMKLAAHIADSISAVYPTTKPAPKLETTESLIIASTATRKPVGMSR